MTQRIPVSGCQPFGGNGCVHIQGRITVGFLLYRLHVFRPGTTANLVRVEMSNR